MYPPYAVACGDLDCRRVDKTWSRFREDKNHFLLVSIKGRFPKHIAGVSVSTVTAGGGNVKACRGLSCCAEDARTRR